MGLEWDVHLHEEGAIALLHGRRLILTYCSLQAETFSAPNAQQAAKGAQSIASYHGTTGPVQVTYPDGMYGGPQQSAFVNTIVGLTGVSYSSLDSFMVVLNFSQASATSKTSTAERPTASPSPLSCVRFASRTNSNSDSV